MLPVTVELKVPIVWLAFENVLHLHYSVWIGVIRSVVTKVTLKLTGERDIWSCQLVGVGGTYNLVTREQGSFTVTVRIGEQSGEQRRGVTSVCLCGKIR